MHQLTAYIWLRLLQSLHPYFASPCSAKHQICANVIRNNQNFFLHYFFRTIFMKLKYVIDKKYDKQFVGMSNKIVRAHFDDIYKNNLSYLK